MATRSSKVGQSGVEDCYLKLVRTFPLRPIRSDAELDRAIVVIDSLIDRDALDPGEDDYLDVLGDLVYKYESKHDPVAAVPDSDMVRFLLESNSMSQAELAQRTGIAESTISEILAEKRKLSRRHIAAISKVFQVSPAVFFPEAIEMTPERAAEILSRRSGLELSPDYLLSLAGAFAADSDRGCWRSLQELVAGESPGTPTDLMAELLNIWGDGADCYRPTPFQLSGSDIQQLAEAFATERDCWKLFREMVEETIPDMRAIQREIAEEN